MDTKPLFFASTPESHAAARGWLQRVFASGGQDEIKLKPKELEERFWSMNVLWGPSARLSIVCAEATRSSLGEEYGPEAILAQAAYVLDVICRWGALGAKPQFGFGQVTLPDVDRGLVEKGWSLTKNATARYQPSRQEDFSRNAERFRLDRFFAAEYEIGARNPYLGWPHLIGDCKSFDYRAHFIPCAFDLRYKSRGRNGANANLKSMRQWFRDKYEGKAADTRGLGESRGARVAEALFGKSGGESDDRVAGRIGVSHLFRREAGGPYHLKVWGHVPPAVTAGLGVSVEDAAATALEFLNEVFEITRVVAEFKKEEVLGH